MLTLINTLILFFAILIFYQIFLEYFRDNIIEGLTSNTYQPYDTNNPNNALILAQQNAGNITVLQQEITSLNGLNQEVQDISGNVASLQSQVNSLVKAQNDYANNMTGGTEPQITGTTDDSSSDPSSTTDPSTSDSSTTDPSTSDPSTTDPSTTS